MESWQIVSFTSLHPLPLCLSAKPDSAHRPLLRTNSEDHGPLKAKNQSPNSAKEKAAGKKSSDSSEEADKDFILIWVKTKPGSGYIFVVIVAARNMFAGCLQDNIFNQVSTWSLSRSLPLPFTLNWFSVAKLCLRKTMEKKWRQFF